MKENLTDSRDMEKAVRRALKKMAASPLNLKTARELIYRVEERAKEMGVKAVVAVSDCFRAAHCDRSMDGAFIGSFDVALNKTFTSVAFQMSTAELGKLASPAAHFTESSRPMEGRS